LNDFAADELTHESSTARKCNAVRSKYPSAGTPKKAATFIHMSGSSKSGWQVNIASGVFEFVSQVAAELVETLSTSLSSSSFFVATWCLVCADSPSLRKDLAACVVPFSTFCTSCRSAPAVTGEVFFSGRYLRAQFPASSIYRHLGFFLISYLSLSYFVRCSLNRGCFLFRFLSGHTCSVILPQAKPPCIWHMHVFGHVCWRACGYVCVWLHTSHLCIYLHMIVFWHLRCYYCYKDLKGRKNAYALLMLEPTVQGIRLAYCCRSKKTN